MTRLIGLLLLATALTGSQALGQTASPKPEHRLDLFIRALRPPSDGSASGGATIPQSKFEQVLRMVPPVSTGHGGGAPLVQSSQGAAAASQDTSVYGFCYQACATERAVGSCGTPAPGKAHAPMQMCEPIEFNPTLSAIIGPQLGTGASPFVDDNKSADPAQQPAGYTFFGQFIDHDVTRTQTALSALNELNQRAQGDANCPGKTRRGRHHPGSAETSDRKRRNTDLGAEPQHRQARPRQRVRRHRLCRSDRDHRAVVRAEQRRLYRPFRAAPCSGPRLARRADRRLRLPAHPGGHGGGSRPSQQRKQAHFANPEPLRTGPQQLHGSCARRP